MIGHVVAVLALVAAESAGEGLMTLDELYAHFRNPGNGYRIAPLLRMNDTVSREEVRWQVSALKRAGCGGCFTYCERMNDGLPVEFVSEDWWRIVRWTAEACAEEGLDFWVYDDQDWPSGRAADRLVEERPDWSWHYLHVDSRDCRGPIRARVDVPDPGLVAVVAHRRDRVEAPVDLTGAAADGHLEWEAPEGDWTVTVYSRRSGPGFFTSSLADLMNREAMSEYVRRVYEGHRAAVADVPDLRFVGYFTDEPCGSISMTAFGDKFTWFPSLPYTPELPAAFERIAGVDFRTSLPALHEREDPGALKLQFAFWQACAELLDENYFGQIRRFCERHGLEASGHLNGEEEFQFHLAQYFGNLAGLYRQMHTPGIDWIHPLENRLPAVVPKYAASAAHRLGRDRAWCESFAGSGWGLTFDQMRAIVNWEHVNGIGFQIPISYKYSLRGPKRATFYNPGISYQQPYWEHFRAFADYEARLCALVGTRGHVAQIALTYPGVDIWAHAWNHDVLGSRSQEYKRLGDLLRFAGYDFDILDDKAVAEEVRVEGPALTCAGERFAVLVLPRADALRRAVAARCLEFAEAGGLVLLVGDVPRHSPEYGAQDPELAALFQRLLGTTREEALQSGTGTWRPCGAGPAALAADAEAALALLAQRVDPDVRALPPDAGFVASHRRLADGHLYLLLSHGDAAREFRVSLSVDGYPERWNPATGLAEPVERWTRDDAGLLLTLDFLPHELIPVVIRTHADAAPSMAALEPYAEIPVDGPFRFALKETMTQPHVAWNFSDDRGSWTSRAGQSAAPSTISLGDWCAQGIPYFSGIGVYEKEVTVGALPEGVHALLDLGMVAQSAEVVVNGQSAGYVCLAPYRLDVSDHLRPGPNTLRIEVANTLSNYYAQFEELAEAPVHAGGDVPERRRSGLFGPVTLRLLRPTAGSR